MFVLGAILALICLVSEHRSNCLEQRAIEKLRKTGYIKGDFMIGALFPIHGSPNSTNQRKPLECDVIRSPEGIQLVEAAFYAVDSINNDESILPKHKLGLKIKDECWSELVALYQTIELTRVPALIGRNLGISRDNCSNKTEATLIGVIGTASGTNAILVQNILELFQIPSIGYSASVSKLRNAHFYLSVIPSVHQEAYMIVQILIKFKLTYFSIAYTDDYFGISGRFYVQEWAEYFKICVASDVHIPHPRQKKMHSNAIRKLFEDERVKVVVCFCDGLSVISLFAEIKERNLTGDFMVIGIYDWLTYDFTLDGYEEEARGSVMIDIRGKHVLDFDRYYLAKKLHNNQRNPWFEEFWQYRFRCGNYSSRALSTNCTGMEDLAGVYEQGSKVSYVIKSVYAFAHALHQMYNMEPSLQPFNLTKYMGYLKNLNFSFHDEYVDFIQNGSPAIAYYDVFNFQKINGKFRYVKIYEYSYDSINFDQYTKSNWSHFKSFANYQLPGGGATFKSSCSDPCLPGQFKRNHISGKFAENREEISCCWSCISCEPDEIVIDNKCKSCPTRFWPNTNRTKCQKLPTTYAQWTDLQFHLAKILSAVGIVLTIFTTAVFLKHRNTPVVKSSTRELCYIILFGVLMQHCAIFLCVAEPSMVTCYLLRICPTLSATLVFGALLVKTNRIARLLAISKRRFPNLNPRFMTLKAQCTLVFILITVQVILISINIALWQNYLIETRVGEKEKTVLIRCFLTAESGLTCMLYNLLLMLLCCYYAIKARNVPDNFNEAKFIGFLSYITTLTCIACTLIYYGSQWKMLSVGISMSVNGFNVLIFLFFPKLYVILWLPERNTRQYFTTATGIRCIIGRKDIISNQNLLRKKFMRKDLENIEDLNSLRTSSTKEASEETASTIT